MTTRRALVAVLCGAWLLAGCGEPSAARADGNVRVFAAASLVAPFQAIARAFEAEQPGRRVALNFAGTPELVLQLREGAPADVFASADPPNMQKVVDAGLVAGQPVEFARNHMVIAVAAGNPRGVRGLADLARSDLLVALCGPDVPAGRYARQALQQAGVVVASRSDEPSVKALVGKVALGELDAGIVYATDTRISGVAAVPLPEQHSVATSYPIAVLAGAADRVGAEAFVAFVRGKTGRALLAEHGFLLP